MILQHESTGRNRQTITVLLTVWIGILILGFALDAAILVLGIAALVSLPTLWDVISNRASGLTLTQECLDWFSGPNAHSMPLREIDHIRFDRRLDGSIRVTLVLKSGRKWRLPPDALPPAEPFEAALQSLGMRTQRHPFSLLG